MLDGPFIPMQLSYILPELIAAASSLKPNSCLFVLLSILARLRTEKNWSLKNNPCYTFLPQASSFVRSNWK